MTDEDIFAAWSPEGSLWSTWAKPVLFAHLGTSFALPPGAEVSPDTARLPGPEEKVAMVLDLPGEEGVWMGVALAAGGYRPVPLYNAVPLPFGAPILDPLSRHSIAAVNVLPIISALRCGAGQLKRMNIPPDAPPAFLLDANRHGDHLLVRSDTFDNRSICFTTDFPSATFLQTHGIQCALLIQRDRVEPRADLAQVLRRWQDGGLRLERMRMGASTGREPFQVNRPSWYGAMFQRALAAVGLQRAPGGGFGAWMPDSSAGG